MMAIEEFLPGLQEMQCVCVVGGTVTVRAITFTTDYKQALSSQLVLWIYSEAKRKKYSET